MLCLTNLENLNAGEFPVIYLLLEKEGGNPFEVLLMKSG